MQAKSIEDNQIDFNVYIFNVEPGVTINYADGSSRVGTTENNQTSSAQAKESTQPLNPGDGSVSTNELTVHDGGKATVTVKTKPNVQGTIEVDYGSGPSHASGLEPKTSDAKGKISWTWTVGSRTKAGTYNVIIKVNGETITKQLVVN